jgi:hypothetical protein
MTKRRLLLCLALLAPLGLGGGLLVLLAHPRHRINQGSYERIKQRMTLEEVEAILGGPPLRGNFWDYSRDWDAQVRETVFLFWMNHFDGFNPDSYLWVGDRGAIVVAFNESGKLMWKEMCELPRQGLLDKLRHLLPW